MKNKYPHFDLKIDENNSFIWYCNSSGYVYKILKTDPKKKKIYLSGFIKKGQKVISIRQKQILLKTLVAKTFYSKYYPGICIAFKDKNPLNCSIDNMIFYSLVLHGKKTGGLTSKCKKVCISEKGKPQIIFSSVRKAANYLYCSYQTLLDYLNKKVSSSVLSNPDRYIFFVYFHLDIVVIALYYKYR